MVGVDSIAVRTAVMSGVRVVTVRGDLDLVNGPAMRHHLLEATGRGSTGRDSTGRGSTSGDSEPIGVIPLRRVATSRDTVVDLSDVEFLDSAGLTVLVQAHKRLRRVGGSLRLVGLRPRLARLLAMTALDRALPTYADLADALAASRSGAGSGSTGSSPPGPDGNSGATSEHEEVRWRAYMSACARALPRGRLACGCHVTADHGHPRDS